MTNLLKGISIFLMTILFVSCGSDAAQKEAEKKEKAKEELAGNITDVLSGLEGGAAGLGETLRGVAEAVSGGEVDDVEIVSFRDMKALLPSKVAGMEMVDHEGQTTGIAGMKGSTLTAKYAGDDKKMKVEMIDTGGVGMALLGALPWTTMTVDKESSKGYERTTEYKGMKAFEEYDNKRESGSMTVLVAKRFIVKVEGRGVKMNDIKDGLSEISFKDLAKLGEK